MKSIFIITRRECGSYFGTPIAWIFIAMQIAILSFFFFQFSPFFVIESADMRVWFGLTPFMLMVFAPAVTMRLWSEELRTGTTEVLLSLPVRVQDLVVGKWLAAVVVLLASVVCSFGIPLTIFWLAASSAVSSASEFRWPSCGENEAPETASPKRSLGIRSCMA